MTDILLAVGTAMRAAAQDKTRAKLAQQATEWLKPLISQAGGVINGEIETDPTPVSEVDEVDAVDAIMASF